MEIAIEDDVFFADLSKQISLLIMDDDDDGELINHSSSLSFQTFSQPIHQTPRVQYQQEQPIYRRECKGTGVFIPRSSSNLRKKNKQEKCNPNNNAKYNKHFNNSRSRFGSPQNVAHNTININSSSTSGASSYYNISNHSAQGESSSVDYYSVL